MNINIINKHNYLGEHQGKANILLSATVDDVFSIIFEDEDNGVKSSWEMTMYRDDAEKIARHFAEILGIIPIERKGEWIKHIDNLFPEESTEECSICHEEQFLNRGNDDNFCPNCGARMKGGAEMANKDRITELENELKLMKEQLYRLCACLYPQALGGDELDYIVTGKQKGGEEE